MKVAISPSSLYVPGIVQRILGEIGSGPVHVDELGKVHAELTQVQLDLFKLKGAAHHVEVLPEGVAAEAPAAMFPEPEPDPDEPPLTITIETSPGVRQVMKVGPQGLEPMNQEKSA